MNARFRLRGRSSVLRVAQRTKFRSRAYVARWAVTLVCVGALVSLVVGVEARVFPTEGPLAAPYVLHDRLYLPFKGAMWTAIRPYGTVWVAFVVVVATTVLVEALSPLGPFRAAHRRVIRSLLHSGLGWRALRSIVLALGHRRWGLGFARAVVDTELHVNRIRARRLVGERDVRLTRRIMWLANLSFLLSDKDELDRLRLFEAVTLARAFRHDRQCEALVDTLINDLLSGSSSEWGDAIAFVANPSDGFGLEVADAVHAMSHGADAIDPLSVARALLVAVVEVVETGRQTSMAPWQAWARLRRSTSAATQDILREIESSIDFEFWAALSEVSVRSTLASPVIAPLLDGVPRRQEFGERFAWDGGGS